MYCFSLFLPETCLKSKLNFTFSLKNSQKDYIQSANHTKGWGRIVTNKTALLPFVEFDDHDAEEFIRAIEHSYDARRLAAIKQNNAQQIP